MVLVSTCEAEMQPSNIEVANFIHFLSQFFFYLLGSCIQIANMDEIAIIISIYNKNIRSLDFWKTSNLTQIGVAALGNCIHLQEIDFGWW